MPGANTLLNGRLKRILQKISSNDHIPAHAADSLPRDDLLLQLHGDAGLSDARLQLHHGADDAGWAHSLPCPSLPHPSLLANVA